jgi:hypothetical protein
MEGGGKEKCRDGRKEMMERKNVVKIGENKQRDKKNINLKKREN